MHRAPLRFWRKCLRKRGYSPSSWRAIYFIWRSDIYSKPITLKPCFQVSVNIRVALIHPPHLYDPFCLHVLIIIPQVFCKKDSGSWFFTLLQPTPKDYADPRTYNTCQPKYPETWQMFHIIHSPLVSMDDAPMPDRPSKPFPKQGKNEQPAL